MVGPLLVSPTTFDATLQSSSPAMDVLGVTNAAPTEDFLGKMRDTNPDIGAIEYINGYGYGLPSVTLESLKFYLNPTNNSNIIRDLKLNNLEVINFLGHDFTSSTSLNGVELILIQTTIWNLPDSGRTPFRNCSEERIHVQILLYVELFHFFT